MHDLTIKQGKYILPLLQTKGKYLQISMPVFTEVEAAFSSYAITKKSNPG